MSSLGEVGDALRAIADSLPLALLDQAGDSMQEAASMMSYACEGSSQHGLHEARTTCAWALTEIGELLRLPARTRATLLGVAAGLGQNGGASVPASAVASGPVRPSMAQRVDAARRALPDKPGPQAQGRWLGPGLDSTVIRSGRGDVWHDRAVEFVRRDLGPRYLPTARLATHMEVKLAMRMRHEGRMRETLVIDRKVCGSPGEAQESKRYTCHSMVGPFPTTRRGADDRRERWGRLYLRGKDTGMNGLEASWTRWDDPTRGGKALVGTPGQVDTLLEALADEHAEAAILNHTDRALVPAQDTQDEPFPDHQVWVAVRGDWGYLQMWIIGDDNIQVAVGDPDSPAFESITCEWDAGSGMTLPRLKAALVELLETANRPTSVQWQADGAQSLAS